MSSLENTSALKIQEAWQKYYESKDSCPICLKIIGLDSCITKCGHKFCTGCLLQSVQNKNTCPLCRNKLVQKSDNIEDVDYITREYQAGYNYGYYTFEKEIRSNIRQYINISRIPNSDVNGRSLSSEIMSIFREELDIAKQKAYDQGVKDCHKKMLDDIDTFYHIMKGEEPLKQVYKEIKPKGQRGTIDGLNFDDPDEGWTDEDYKEYCVDTGIQWWL